MERDDHVHNPGISVNEYADCNLDPQNVHSGAILWDGVLIGHIPGALEICQYLMKNSKKNWIVVSVNR